MFKQGLLMIIASIIAVYLMSYLAIGLQWLSSLHSYVISFLDNIFSPGLLGDMIKNVIALLAVPALIGVISTGISWVMRRSVVPQVMGIVWIVWLILLTVLTSQTV